MYVQTFIANVKKLKPISFFRREVKTSPMPGLKATDPAEAKSYSNTPAGFVEKARDLQMADGSDGAVRALLEAVSLIKAEKEDLRQNERSHFVGFARIDYLGALGYDIKRYNGVAATLLSVSEASDMLNRKIIECCQSAADICGKAAAECAGKKDFAGAAEAYSEQGRLLVYAEKHTRGWTSYGLGDELLCKAVEAFSSEAFSWDAAIPGKGKSAGEAIGAREYAIGKMRTAYALVGLPVLIKAPTNEAFSLWRQNQGRIVTIDEILV